MLRLLLSWMPFRKRTVEELFGRPSCDERHTIERRIGSYLRWHFRHPRCIVLARTTMYQPTVLEIDYSEHAGSGDSFSIINRMKAYTDLGERFFGRKAFAREIADRLSEE